MKTTEQNADAWKRHEDEQRRRWLELTPLERLRWLDGAKSFVALVEATRTEHSTLPRETKIGRANRAR
jgi:hypothetical protein